MLSRLLVERAVARVEPCFPYRTTLTDGGEVRVLDLPFGVSARIHENPTGGFRVVVLVSGRMEERSTGSLEDAFTLLIRMIPRKEER